MPRAPSDMIGARQPSGTSRQFAVNAPLPSFSRQYSALRPPPSANRQVATHFGRLNANLPAPSPAGPLSHAQTPRLAAIGLAAFARAIVLCKSDKMPSARLLLQNDRLAKKTLRQFDGRNEVACRLHRGECAAVRQREGQNQLVGKVRTREGL